MTSEGQEVGGREARAGTARVRPDTVFRECARRAEECRSQLVGAPSALRWQWPSPVLFPGGAWPGRPVGLVPTAKDASLFLAEFRARGVEALRERGRERGRSEQAWRRREALFLLFHCEAGGPLEVKPREARRLLGLRERTFWEQVEQVADVAGRHFLRWLPPKAKGGERRAPLWPLGRFFR